MDNVQCPPMMMKHKSHGYSFLHINMFMTQEVCAVVFYIYIHLISDSSMTSLLKINRKAWARVSGGRRGLFESAFQGLR